MSDTPTTPQVQSKLKPFVSLDLQPEALMKRFGADLCERMGQRAWQQRLQVEQRINPAVGMTWTRIVHRAFHLASKGLISSILSLSGQRKRAQSNCWTPTQTQSSLELPRLKAKQQLTILHLSDFHLDTRLDLATQWAEQIRSLNADLCVITGDFLNGFQLPSSETLNALQTVIDAIPAPVFGILGNHDCIFSAPYLEQLGVTLLLNETRSIRIHDLTLEITGLDDPHFFKSDDLDHALKAREALNPPDLRMLLVHAPMHPETYAGAGFDLCLCGHTHGGQLCTRTGTPLLRNGRYRGDTISGAWKQDRLRGYTSRGTGTGRLAYRLNCAPEIALHHVRAPSTRE